MHSSIDILFATHNGANTLPRMLDALSRLEPPDGTLRILAVDNASTDGTADLLAGWAARLPLTVLTCAIPGKMEALKSAVPHLEGELVVLTDDDIVPDPLWIRALAAAAAEFPGAAIFGGSIEPDPIEATEPWYRAVGAHERDLFALTKAPRGPVSGADHIFGPNMMLRRAEAQAALTAPGALGPTFVERGAKRVFPLGDESLMIESLERSGASAVFVPEARVKHMVRTFQTRLPFMLQRAQNHGRGVALRAVSGKSDVAGRARIALASAIRVPGIYARAARIDRSRPDPRAFETLYGLNWHIGRVKGALSGPFDGRD